MNKKIILSANKSIIEPLALLHLNSIAKEERYLSKIILYNEDFSNLEKEIYEFNPKFLGISLLTGSHQKVFDYINKMKRKHPNIDTIVGGPHATVFSQDCSKIFKYTVLSEGFNSFRRILQGKEQPGIIPMTSREEFPESDRRDFYKSNPEYDQSPIKSIITSTGCPWECTYCYNSSKLSSLEGILTETQKEEMHMALGTERLFPKSSRSVDNIIYEIKEIQTISPNTKMIYFQDDVFGISLEWVKEFAEKYKCKMPFHAQMRFENTNPYSHINRERLKLIREAGCTGLTLAIESENPIVREEVLNRRMHNSMIYESMQYLSGLGFKVRTEQMLGLPLGATSKETPINLEADLKTLEMNVNLRKETGLPTMAWASIFAPYRGTKIGEYCNKHGFYKGGNNDVPETFFQRSVLRFPKKYIGPGLNEGMKEAWLSEEEQNKYKDDMQLLRDLFSYFAQVPEGHKLAETFLKGKDHSYASLSKETRHHLYNECLYKVD